MGLLSGLKNLFGNKADAEIPVLETIEGNKRHYRHGKLPPSTGWCFKMSIVPEQTELAWGIITSLLKDEPSEQAEQTEQAKQISKTLKTLLKDNDKKFRREPWHMSTSAPSNPDGIIYIHTLENTASGKGNNEAYDREYEIVNLIEKAFVQCQIKPKIGMPTSGRSIPNSSYMVQELEPKTPGNKAAPADPYWNLFVEKQCLKHRWRYDPQAEAFELPLVGLEGNQAVTIRRELQAAGIQIDQSAYRTSMTYKLTGDNVDKFYNQLYKNIPEFKKHEWHPSDDGRMPFARMSINGMTEEAIRRIENELEKIKVKSARKISHELGPTLRVSGFADVLELNKHLFDKLEFAGIDPDNTIDSKQSESGDKPKMSGFNL